MADDLFDLSGKVALVAGGGSDIGRAIATALAEAGADVAVLGRNVARLEETREAIQRTERRSLTVEGDIRRVADLDEAVARVVGGLGGLHILVNAAGTVHGRYERPSVDVDETAWDEQTDTLLKGTFFACRAAARHFLPQREGKIINLCSTSSYVAYPQTAVYCASKGGVLQLTRALAVEWASEGINVNAIAPGAVKTDATAYFFEQPGNEEAARSTIPAGRLSTPADIGGAALFLASRAADMVHGHCLIVDGAYTAV